VGAFARLIAHHPDGVTLAAEGAVVVLVVLVLGGIWLRERRRRVGRSRRTPTMRD
jgi:hypothetical protein